MQSFAPPGGNGFIAFTSNQRGSYDIWLYNPQNGANFRLTQNLAEEFSSPQWSPDSQKIAFIGKEGVVYILNMAMGKIAKVDQIEPYTSLSWSPNSQILSYKKQNNIILYNTRKHTAQKLNLPGVDAVQWFPSGKELLYAGKDANDAGQLYRIKVDGSNKRQITHNINGPLHELKISPNGIYGLYTSPGASISLIYTVELATGRTYNFPGAPLGKNYNPVWSPHFNLVLYSATFFQNHHYYSYIQTANRFGQDTRKWAISNCFSTPVSWSPDSNKMVYLSGCTEEGPATQIWVLDRRHPQPIQILEGGNISAVQWSPTVKANIPT